VHWLRSRCTPVGVVWLLLIPVLGELIGGGGGVRVLVGILLKKSLNIKKITWNFSLQVERKRNGT